MVDFLKEGGYPMYVIAAIAVAVIVSIVRSAMSGPRVADRARVDAILFWGSVALIVGVIGTLVGFSQMARAVERMGTVSQPILWGGIRVALTAVIAGLLIFAAAFIAWAILRRRSPRQSVA
jgi:MotA/TolQ/ExbB proton channel family